MNDIHIGIIGTLAGICTTISFVPQVIKIMKTRHTRDISMEMYLVLTGGIALWFIYGIFLGEWPIMIANGISFVLCSSIIIAKIKYG